MKNNSSPVFCAWVFYIIKTDKCITGFSTLYNKGVLLFLCVKGSTAFNLTCTIVISPILYTTTIISGSIYTGNRLYNLKSLFLLRKVRSRNWSIIWTLSFSSEQLADTETALRQETAQIAESTIAVALTLKDFEFFIIFNTFLKSQ